MHSLSKYKISAADRYTSFLLPILLIIVDYIAIVIAEQVAFVIRNFLIPNGGVLHISWFNFWVVFPLLYLIFINVGQLYSRKMQFWSILERIFQASCYAIVSIVIVLYIGQMAASTSRLFIVLFGILSFFFLVSSRYVAKKILEYFDFLQTPVLIIGAGKTAEILVNGIIGDAGMGYKIIGLLEDNLVKDGILKKFSVLGGFTDVENVIRHTGVKNVLIAAPGLEQSKLTELIYKVQPLVKNMGIIPNLVGVPMGGIEVESLFNEKLMLLRLKNNLARPVNRYIKVVFDFLMTLLGSIVIAPILLFISVWIYLDSPGPIIFSHIRIGKDGKEFPCYKFRSMCVDANSRLKKLLEDDPCAKEEWDKNFKLKNDPRITKSGAFLRKTSLDELPQIFNVLKGEMSLVGPRPIIKAEMERYGDYINDYLMVKPGITGMWQVNGRNDIDYSERVLLDSWYVRNWNIWIDFVMLFKTFKVVIRKDGAY